MENRPPATPHWEYDPDFDIDYHLRRVSAPAPGTLDTVLEMARRAEMAEFDRARPLWETTLVEGLQDGAAAIVAKMHHSLADGIGALQIAMILYDTTRQAPDRGPLPPSRTSRHANRWTACWTRCATTRRWRGRRRGWRCDRCPPRWSGPPGVP